MSTLPRLKNSDNLSQWASKINDGFEQLELVGEGTLTTVEPLNAGEFIVYWGEYSLTNTNKAFGTYYNTDAPYQNLGDLTVTIPSNNHIVRNISITDAGSGYSTAPYVTFSNPYVGSTVFPGSTGTTIDSVVGSTGFASGSIVSSAFAITGATGVSYKFYKATTAIPNNSIVPLHSNGLANNWLFIGRNARATVTVSSGSISDTTVQDGGYGYSTLPTFTITPTSGGTGAVLTPEMYSDVVASLTVGSIENKSEIASLTDTTRATDYLLVYDSSTLKKIKISTITPDVPTGSVLFGSPTDSYTWDSTNFHWDDVNNRLGLGTNTPDALLTVAGVGAFGDGATGFPSITNTGDLDTGFWFPLSNTIAASTAGVERIRITSTGEIGIGTISPDALLTVAGVGAFGDGSASTPSITNTGDLNTGLWFPTADTIAASTAGVERVRIDSLGNVGIGTTTLTHRLNVIGGRSTFTASNESYAIGVGYSSQSVGYWIGSNATNDSLIFLAAGGTERVRFTSDGNVGIGTISPSYKLDIVGDTNISTGSVYRIDGTSVLSTTTLGSSVITSSLTTVGAITSGTWNATVITGQYGGTGVNNSGKTITLGGNLTTSGAFNVTLIATNNTSITLPVSGTLLTNTSRTIALTGDVTGSITSDLTGNISIATTIQSTTIPAGSNWNGNPIEVLYGGTGNSTGNAVSATTLQTSRNFSLTGNVTATAVGFNGSGNVTLTTVIGAAVVTNDMLAGSIANNKLVNSSITINGTSVSLGGSITVASIGGSNTQVQFNSSGTLTGSANMTFDGTRLTVAALTVTGNLTATLSGNASSATIANSITGQANSATTNATASNVANQIVLRDGSGNFSAGTITAALNATGITATGRIFAQAAQSSGGIANVTSSLGGVELVGAGGSNAAFIAFHRPGVFGAYFGLDSDNQFKVGGWSFLANAYVLLHSANFTSYSPSLTGSGASGTWAINITGNAATATTANTATTATTATSASSAVTLSTNQSNWSTNGTISAVVGQLAWKNYGNSHTIFDASQGTSPSGGSVNNTNAATPWSATYPTLMGWNGSGTYGVRVDSARVADSATTAGSITSQANSATITASTSATANTIVLRDASGHISGNQIFSSYLNSSDDVSAGNISFIMAKFGDNYLRSATAAKVAAFISGQSMNIVGNATTATTASNLTGQANSATITATSSNVANQIVLRDGSGNFSAGIITATNYGAVNASTGTFSGRVSGSGSSYRLVLPVGTNFWAT